jgi:hypothetical protein
MAALNKFNSFAEAVYEKAHNMGSDTLTVALCATANAPVAGNTVLANLTQIAYTNLSTRVISTASAAQTGGTYKLTLTDLVLSASGGSVAAFQYVVVYNDTAAADELCWWYNYGSALTLADGESLTIDFDGTNGAITHA